MIDGKMYVRMVRLGAASLASERKSINDLNVFPIPDGDTGDNMYMTIESGCNSAADTESLSDAAKSVASGMLLGARGNSGVILSRIFAGLAKGFEGLGTADAGAFRKALRSAVSEAYGAVSVPVEGTILTVLREGVENCSGSDPESLSDSICEQMAASLEHTPELLDVLKNAGVVDSGGAGLLCIFKGLRDALHGKEAGLAPFSPSGVKNVNLDAFGPDSELEFGYCTEFLLRLQSSKVDLQSFDEACIKEWLNSAGESVVCFREGSIVKVHVHTRTPGEILNKCQEWGEFLTIKIENMTLQHHETHPAPAVRRKTALVAVTSGNGLVQMFRELGADVVIEGGQTMNPSVESFLNAFRELNAERIFVFPNNSNIVLTARQAAGMFKDSEVIVLPTKNPGAGIVVMGSTDFNGFELSELPGIEAMAESVVCAMVSRAIRDAEGVKTGDYIGICGGGIACADPDRKRAVGLLMEKLDAAHSDVAMLIYGSDTPSAEAEELCANLQRQYPRTELILRDGGQAVYDYILIIQ